MSPEKTHSPLHLPSLSIKGFRGIKDLSISRLGRVTLLAGKNSVGKTTVLDAVRVYAARGRHDLLSYLLQGREEVHRVTDEGGDSMMWPDFAALFHGREATEDTCIRIGPQGHTDQLQIRKIIHNDLGEALEIKFENATITVFPLTIDGLFRRYRRLGAGYGRPFIPEENNTVPAIECNSLGPGLLDNHQIASYWDKVALTNNDDQAVEALKMILGDDVERVATIGDDGPPNGPIPHGRRVIVKTGQANPVPLRSMGDGALRFFSVALALANSADGFLLIDESENGIHHSVQRDFWRMILHMATENNVQVLATTHSFDCIRGFAQTVAECDDADGALVRIERKDDETWAVEYSQSDLNVAAEQDIEVR